MPLTLQYHIMDDIDSLEELIKHLDKAEKKDVPAIFTALRLHKKDLDQFASWCDGSYTRNCVYRSESYELILLCWSKGCETPIHDHGGQDCWVYQAVGELTERRFEKNESGELIETNKMVLSPGGITYMSDVMGYHSLANESDLGGYTLHLYASPIDKCDVFNEDSQVFETKEMAYDTVSDELVGI